MDDRADIYLDYYAISKTNALDIAEEKKDVIRDQEVFIRTYWFLTL